MKCSPARADDLRLCNSLKKLKF